MEKSQIIDAVHTEFKIKGMKTNEWHSYICSRVLTREDLLHHTRMEWSVETAHWLLDVHFGKPAPKQPISKNMLDCLLDSSSICTAFFEN